MNSYSAKSDAMSVYDAEFTRHVLIRQDVGVSLALYSYARQIRRFTAALGNAGVGGGVLIAGAGYNGKLRRMVWTCIAWRVHLGR